MNKLTEEQIKSLKLFSYYCMSYGGEEVDRRYWIEDCGIHDFDGGWTKPYGSPIESYERIDNTIDEIIDENDLVYGGDRDCDSRGSIEINIDCLERKIRITANEVQTNYEYESDSKGYDELKEDESFVNFFQNMKDNGFERGVVNFDGAGDSGEIYETIEYDGKYNEKLPNEILEFLYDWLSNVYGGWEIDEGSHGIFNFTKNGDISLDFNWRRNDDVDLGTIFYAEF